MTPALLHSCKHLLSGWMGGANGPTMTMSTTQHPLQAHDNNHAKEVYQPQPAHPSLTSNCPWGAEGGSRDVDDISWVIGMVFLSFLFSFHFLVTNKIFRSIDHNNDNWHP
jgi:hypothetical protein